MKKRNLFKNKKAVAQLAGLAVLAKVLKRRGPVGEVVDAAMVVPRAIGAPIGRFFSAFGRTFKVSDYDPETVRPAGSSGGSFSAFGRHFKVSDYEP